MAWFRDLANQRENVTAAVTAGTHREENVVPEEAGRSFCVEVSPSNRLRKTSTKKVGKGKRARRVKRVRILKKTYSVRVTATSETYGFRSDTAGVTVRTR